MTTPAGAPSRTPPNQKYIKQFIFYGALGVPEVDISSYRLRITGLVDNPLEFTYDQLRALPQLTIAKPTHCLLPGSKVYANPEPLSIEKVRVGDKVIGVDGLPHPVEKLVSFRYEGDSVKVKAHYLPEVEMTSDHPVWAVKGHPGVGKSRSDRRIKTFGKGFNPVWTKAEDLGVGDYVYFPKYRFVSSRKYETWSGRRFVIDEELASILGWYVAEGYGRARHTLGFCLNTEQKDEVDKLRASLRKRFGARVSTYVQGKNLVVTVTSSEVPLLVDMMDDWCGHGAENKKIPPFIMNANVSVLRAFILSYLKGDGYYPYSVKGRFYSEENDFIDFTTSSQCLAYQLVLALSKLGMPANIVNHPGSVRDALSVRVRGRYVAKLIPDYPVIQMKDKYAFWETPDGFYYPIASISKSRYAGPVYDFVAEGLTMLSPFATQDCVTGWSVADSVWRGPSLPALLKEAGLKPEAKWIMFTSLDGYDTPVPLEDGMVEDAVVALTLNGQAISPEMGFPARPFMPHIYFWKSAKWLNGIKLLADYQDGYWEARGYHERGDIWEEERFKSWGKHERHSVIKRVLGL